ncbi:MAG: hypothetical protein ABL940_13650 [Bacteroidia bacterium]
MKHLSITLPDSLYITMLNLFKSMPDVIVKEDKQVSKAVHDVYDIPQAHKDLVLQRKKSTKEHEYTLADETLQQIREEHRL